MQLFAILGSHPALSNAELESVLDTDVSFTSETVSLFDDVSSVDLVSLQRRLGGTQKLGTIIGSFERGSKQELAEFLAAQFIADQPVPKIFYGISIYELSPTARTQELRGQQSAIGLEIKTFLKEAGIKSRFVTSKQQTLSSVDIVKNNLLERGAEFVFITTEKQVLIGRTECVQDFEDWSYRDYHRPARDAKRGMLPPKLARIMVNLSGATPDGSVLLDPFCGSGTVLMEAAMIGFQNSIGSDISEAAIKDTKENLAWLDSIGIEAGTVELHESTAANTKAFLEDASIDVIVTEPFLGTPRQGKESAEVVEDAIAELAQLYKESFASLVQLLKPGGSIVIASPVHFVNGETFPVPTKDILKTLGLKERPIADEPIIYHREGQFVGREIVRFVK